ncbi:unnamed protein product [Moneuplotes crassus]|uniref:Uncharacterized protein n=1 Tax=Euplotes crassus TaxID=5936 RepID=A0AAD2D869_EUPCR|nr:unnamed protein product [Moneuplotes crassus]
MSFYLLNPENAKKLEEKGIKVNVEQDSKKEESESMPPQHHPIDQTIPITPTKTEQKRYNEQATLNLQENTKRNQKLSEEAVQLKNIEKNIIKQMIHEGFMVSQTAPCPAIYKNLSNCIKNHYADENYDELVENCGFYTEKLLLKKCIQLSSII